MGLELDWLEREERYRRRVLRLLIGALVVVGLVIAVIAVLRTRQANTIKQENERRATEAREAERQAKRDAWVADSTNAATRLSDFMRTHGAEPVGELPLIAVPLPHGASAPALVQRLWTEYARVADPQVSAEQESNWFKQYYVEIMNVAPLRGTAVLLPLIKQDGTQLSFVKATFSDITQAQIQLGMREMPAEVLPDSLAVQALPPSSATDATPPAAPAPSPAPTPPPAPEPAPTPEPAPAETLPEPEPLPEPAPEPPVLDPSPAPDSGAAPPDTIPKP